MRGHRSISDVNVIGSASIWFSLARQWAGRFGETKEEPSRAAPPKEMYPGSP